MSKKEKSMNLEALKKRLSQYRARLAIELQNIPKGKTKNQVPAIVKLRGRIKALQSRVTSISTN